MTNLFFNKQHQKLNRKKCIIFSDSWNQSCFLKYSWIVRIVVSTKLSFQPNIVVNICFYWSLFIIYLLNFLYKVKRTIKYTCKYYILCWAFLLSYLALLLNYWTFLYKVQRTIRYTLYTLFAMQVLSLVA